MAKLKHLHIINYNIKKYEGNNKQVLISWR